jgi:hypothetical protein
MIIISIITIIKEPGMSRIQMTVCIFIYVSLVNK